MNNNIQSGTWFNTLELTDIIAKKLITIFIDSFPFFKECDLTTEHIFSLMSLNYNFHGIVQDRLRKVSESGNVANLYASYAYNGIQMVFPRISLTAEKNMVVGERLVATMSIYPDMDTSKRTKTFELDISPNIESMPLMYQWVYENKNYIENFPVNF